MSAEVEKVIVAIESTVDVFLKQLKGGFSKAEKDAASTAKSMTQSFTEQLSKGGASAGGDFVKAIKSSAFDAEKALKDAMKSASESARKDALAAAQAAGDSMEEAFKKAKVAGEKAANDAFKSFDVKAAQAAHNAAAELSAIPNQVPASGMGQGLGEDMVDGMAMTTGGTWATTKMKGAVTKLIAALALAELGAKAGQVFVESLTQSVEQKQSFARVQAALGLSPKQAAMVGRVSGDLYKQNFGDSVSGVADTVEILIATFPKLRQAGEKQLSRLAGKALNFQTIYGFSPEETFASIGVAVKNGLVKNADQGFDLLYKSMQRMTPIAREEMMSAVEEYSPFFKAMGIKGPQAFGLFVKAAKNGRYGVDKLGDSVKEFSIRSKDLSTTTVSALKLLGFDQLQDAAAANKVVALNQKVAENESKIAAIREATKRKIASLSSKDPEKAKKTLALNEQAAAQIQALEAQSKSYQDQANAAGASVKSYGTDILNFSNQIAGGGPKANAALQKVIDKLLSVKDAAKQQALAVALFGTPFEDLGSVDTRKLLLSMKTGKTALKDFKGAADQAGKTLSDTAGARLTQFKRTIEQNFVEFMGNKVAPLFNEWSVKLQPFLHWLQGIWVEIQPDVKETVASISVMFEEFGKFWDKYGDDITKGIIFLIRYQLKTFRWFATALAVIATIVTNFTTWFSAGWEALWTGVADFFVGVWTFITKGFTSAINGIVGGASWLKQKMVDALTWVFDLPEKFYNLGADIIHGFIEGIKSLGHNIWDAVKAPFASVYQGAKSYYEVHSPSRKMRNEIGHQLMAGLTLGIKDYQNQPADAMRAASEAVYKAAQAGASSVVLAGGQGIGTDIPGGGDTIEFNFFDQKSTPDKVTEALGLLAAFRALHAGV